MGKIAKKSLHKNIISKGGWSIGARRWTMDTRKRGGGIYSTRGGGGGQGYALPWKKSFAICWVFLLLFCMWGGGAFLLRFSLRWGSQGTDARTNVCRGGGGGRQAQKRPR